MNGWKLASSPLMTPMPRAAVCRNSGRPAATARSTRAWTCCHCSPPGSRCSQVIDSGRPLARASCSTRSNSASKRSAPCSRSKSLTTCTTPCCRPSKALAMPRQFGRVGDAGRRVAARCGAVVVAAAGAKSPPRRLATPRAAARAWRRCRRHWPSAAPGHARPSPPCAAGRAAPAAGSRGCAACAPANPCTAGKLSQSKRTPSASATPGMSSTPYIRSISAGLGLALAQRREADAAVAHHQRGHAVVDAGREGFVPAGLAVVVGVDIDEAGCQPSAGGVDAFVCRVA